MHIVLSQNVLSQNIGTLFRASAITCGSILQDADALKSVPTFQSYLYMITIIRCQLLDKEFLAVTDIDTGEQRLLDFGTHDVVDLSVALRLSRIDNNILDA